MNLYISTYLASYRLDLCERLSRDYGFAIYHYCGDDIPADVAPFIGEYSFENNRLPVRHLFGKPYAAGLDGLLARLRPDWVFVQEFSLITLQLLFLRRKYGFRLVSICDDSMDMIAGNDFSWTHRLARRIVPRVLDDLILNSPDTTSWYRARFGKGQTLPIVAEEERYREHLRQAIPAAVRFRQEAEAEGKRLILFVGRLVPLKNLPVLFQAFESLRSDACLAVVGEGPMLQAWQQMGESACFAGARYGTDLLACYLAADVLVLPSYQEAYGAVVGEALMAGCPVVVSDKVGARALVRPGWNGACFSPDSSEDLVSALRGVLSAAPAVSEVKLRDSLCPVSFDESFRQLMEGMGFIHNA